MAYAVFYMHIKFHSKKKKKAKNRTQSSQDGGGHPGISIGCGGPQNDTKKE